MRPTMPTPAFLRTASRPTTTLTALAIIACASTAHAEPTKCRAAIIKATATFVQARAKARQGCEQAKLGGKLAASTRCATEPKTSGRLDKAADKLAAAIGKACGGADKTCGTGDGEDRCTWASIKR